MYVGIHLLILKAARAEVDDFDFRVSRMRQKHVLGLEVAMNDFVTFKENETTQQLLSEAPDKLQGESSKLVCLDELVEIHPQKLSRDAQMAAKVEALHKMNHTMFALGILMLSLVIK